MDSRNFHRLQGWRRLALFLALGLLGTAGVPAFAAVTEVNDYDSLYNAMNDPETAELSQTQDITLGSNGLTVNGSHDLNLNQFSLQQGSSGGFTFAVPESDEGATPTLTLVGDSETTGQLGISDFVNAGSTYGNISVIIRYIVTPTA